MNGVTDHIHLQPQRHRWHKTDLHDEEMWVVDIKTNRAE